MEWSAAYAAMQARGDAPFPPACFYYVLECVRRAAGETNAGALTPRDLVADFRARARADFGAFLPEVLRDWNLRHPADLGEAILQLGKQGLLVLAPEDTREAFAEDTRPLDAAPDASPNEAEA